VSILLFFIKELYMLFFRSQIKKYIYTCNRIKQELYVRINK